MSFKQNKSVAMKNLEVELQGLDKNFKEMEIRMDSLRNRKVRIIICTKLYYVHCFIVLDHNESVL